MSKIPGVKLTDLTRNQDDRGFLYEVVHNYDMEKFGQVYVVGNWCRKTVRGFHRHAELWDYFHIITGSALFVLVYQPDYQLDGGENDVIVRAMLPPPVIETFILSEHKPQVLTVPPGVWHGWISLSNDTRLLSTASTVYNKETPDEERVSADYFGDDVWKVVAR